MNSEFNNASFNIEGICDWKLKIHKTVYPPREDTYLLAKAILKLNKYDGLALEIGCGSGALSMLLAKRGWKVKSCDVNPYAVATSRGNIKKYNLEDKIIVDESGIGEGVIISDKLDLIVWNLPYLNPIKGDENMLEQIEDAAYLDIENGGWSEKLIQVLETHKISNECTVILLFRTLPESNSNPDSWKKRGWSGRKIEEQIIGDEKLEVHAFWRPGSNNKPIFIDECKSTMDEAKENNENHWTRIITNKQTNGRGRKGSHWRTEEGDMIGTWNISKSILNNINPGIFQITAGASIADFLKIGLKWPNDLMSNDFRKMGGIVIESDSEGEYLRVGVGINKNSKFIDGKYNASGWNETLGDLTNIEIFDMVDIALSSNFEEHKLLPINNLSYMIDESWKSLTKTLSRGINIINKDDEKCRVVGLSDDGELEVVGENFISTIDSLEDIRWEYT